MIDKMKKFTCVQDIGDLKSALAEAFEIQKDRFKYVELGRNKTLMMIFFNSASVPASAHRKQLLIWE